MPQNLIRQCLLGCQMDIQSTWLYGCSEQPGTTEFHMSLPRHSTTSSSQWKKLSCIIGRIIYHCQVLLLSASGGRSIRHSFAIQQHVRSRSSALSTESEVLSKQERIYILGQSSRLSRQGPGSMKLDPMDVEYLVESESSSKVYMEQSIYLWTSCQPISRCLEFTSRK